MFSLTKFPMAVIHSLNIVARTYGNWAHQWLTHPTPHPTTPCTVTSPFPSPPHLAPLPSPLTCLPGSQFICIITLHFICGTCMHACIKGTLRHVSYFHCRHVHHAIPAVTELYRHSIVLRYCRYMHLQYNTHFNPLLLSPTHPPLLYPLSYPSPPLPSPSLPPPLPSCCDTFTLGTAVPHHVASGRERVCTEQ